MLFYHQDLQMFEYRTIENNLFCFSLPEICKQTADIYGVDVLTLLN